MNHKGKTVTIDIKCGQFQGIFTARILNIFLSSGYDPFSIYNGVSGGTMKLSSNVSRQYKRNYKIIKKVASNSNLFSIIRYLNSGSYFNLEILIMLKKNFLLI